MCCHVLKEWEFGATRVLWWEACPSLTRPKRAGKKRGAASELSISLTFSPGQPKSKFLSVEWLEFEAPPPAGFTNWLPAERFLTEYR